MAALDFILCLSPWQRQSVLGVARQGPHTAGALGRAGREENHPGLSRNSISQAQHGAAPGGECALEEPLHIPKVVLAFF